MDPFSAFKSEVFRPLACLVLPGLLALSPFVLMVCDYSDAISSYFESHEIVAYLLLLGAATIFGLLLENVGISIERGIDLCMELEYLHGADEVWDTYLSGDGANTNGKRYLGTLVTRLKFVNSFIPALAIFGFGMILLHFQVRELAPWEVGTAAMGCVFLLLWLFRVSIELSEAASNTRQRILVHEGKQVPNYSPSAITVGRERHFAYVLAEVLTSRGNELSLHGRSSFYVFPWLLVRTWKWLALWAVLIALFGFTGWWLGI
jgi:hypothetical protein